MRFLAHALALTLLTIVGPISDIYAQSIKEDSKYYLLTGSYTEGEYEGKGISVYAYDMPTGSLSLVSKQATVNPSFLAVSDDGQYVYAVNEKHADEEGAVTAFQFDKEKGALSPINSQLTGGGDPCYLSLSHDGSLLFVANYSGGSFTVFPIGDNGRLGQALQTIRHSGSSVDKSRQEAPHVHGVYLHPFKDLLYVTDLGADEVVIYPIDTEAAEPIDTANKTVYKTTPGAGPRHILLNEKGNRGYLVHEMGGQVEVLEVDSSGQLSHLAAYDMHDGTFSGKNQGAEVRISPDGRFLYASNRGDADTISLFTIDEDGTLSPVETKSSGGDTPRSFILSPDGRYLLAAHQDSHDIVVFDRHTEDGSLHRKAGKYETGAPVHFVFIKAH